MQQKDEREKAGHGCFPFRKRKSKEIKQYGETRRFEEDGWNLKDHKIRRRKHQKGSQNIMSRKRQSEVS